MFAILLLLLLLLLLLIFSDKRRVRAEVRVGARDKRRNVGSTDYGPLATGYFPVHLREDGDRSR
jgi:hypothetical protein